MGRIWFSCDPGKTGALAIWQDKDLLHVVDYNKEKYKELLQTYKEDDTFLLCEKIDTVYNAKGKFAAFRLGTYIGIIEGLCSGLDINFTTFKSTPREWKKLWPNLTKQKGEKWDNDEGKKRYCELCKELYPKIDLYGPQYDKNGNIEVYKKDNKKKGIKAGNTKLELKDGRAAAILIGRSFIERGLLSEIGLSV